MTRGLALFLFVGVAAVGSEPQAQFVDVGDNVKLEVLDWGGTGRPVMLLAGSGNTAHVYEDFAPQLAYCCHVYGITRRGFGASSKPERGYSTPELAEDVWRVIEFLKLSKPIGIGHSMAGSELSFLAQRHSDQLGALIYLDAIADPMDWPWQNAEFRELTIKSSKGAVGPPPRTKSDNASVDAYRAYQTKIGDVVFPANEIRNMYEINADGSIGKNRTPSFVSNEIDAGSIRKDYRGIQVPVLALVSVPQPNSGQSNESPSKDAEQRTVAVRLDQILMQFIHRWEGNLKAAVPDARVVEVPGAHHYLFQTEQVEVLQEIRAFLKTLK